MFSERSTALALRPTGCSGLVALTATNPEHPWRANEKPRAAARTFGKRVDDGGWSKLTCSSTTPTGPAREVQLAGDVRAEQPDLRSEILVAASCRTDAPRSTARVHPDERRRRSRDASPRTLPR